MQSVVLCVKSIFKQPIQFHYSNMSCGDKSPDLIRMVDICNPTPCPFSWRLIGHTLTAYKVDVPQLGHRCRPWAQYVYSNAVQMVAPDGNTYELEWQFTAKVLTSLDVSRIMIFQPYTFCSYGV